MESHLPRTQAGGALREYLGELVRACGALMEDGVEAGDGIDLFWSQRTARLAALTGRAREEDQECKTHRWHVYQMLHQRLAAADRWPAEHRPYLGARTAHVRRAVRPEGAPGSIVGHEEAPATGEDRDERAPEGTPGADHAAMWGRGLPCEPHWRSWAAAAMRKLRRVGGGGGTARAMLSAGGAGLPALPWAGRPGGCCGQGAGRGGFPRTGAVLHDSYGAAG